MIGDAHCSKLLLINVIWTQVGEIVRAGPIYSVQTGDDLSHISRRFGVSIGDLLLWNPDISDDAVRETG